MKHTFSTSFFIKRNAVKRNGNTPIIVRISVNGQKADISIKEEINPNLWSVQAGRALGKSDEILRINKVLDSVRSSIYNYYRELQESNNVVTAERIKEMYTRLQNQPQTFLKLFKKHNNDAKVLVTDSTYKKYELAYRRVSDFLIEKYDKNDIFLYNLDLTFIIDFEIYLRSDCNLGINMAAKMIQFVKKIITLARNIGILRIDPFLAHKTRWLKSDIVSLTEEEIKRIMRKEISIKRLDIVRDIFLFSCFTGLSYIDVKNLNINNIELESDNIYWIITKRQKNNNKVQVRLFDIPLKIITKYEKERKGIELLPVLSNQKMNAYLKELADICQIRKRLTFHISRHTFATLIMLERGASTETTSIALGHSNIKTTQIYAKVTKKKLSREMNIVSKNLKFPF